MPARSKPSSKAISFTLFELFQRSIGRDPTDPCGRVRAAVSGGFRTMDVFTDMHEMGHERVLLCSNPEVGLKAVIAIHNTVLGPGLGGTRMWPYASFDEAIVDALRLSRGMTYKAAAGGINLGGAKAV